jgi:hypothetical protein
LPPAPEPEQQAAFAVGDTKTPHANGDTKDHTQQEGDGQGGEEGKKEEGEDGEQELPPTPPPQIVKISVPKLVSRLHLATGCMPEELSNLHSFYIIRSRPGKLQFEDLDEALECGVLNERPSLRNLEQVGLWVGKSVCVCGSVLLIRRIGGVTFLIDCPYCVYVSGVSVWFCLHIQCVRYTFIGHSKLQGTFSVFLPLSNPGKCRQLPC